MKLAAVPEQSRPPGHGEPSGESVNGPLETQMNMATLLRSGFLQSMQALTSQAGPPSQARDSAAKGIEHSASKRNGSSNLDGTEKLNRYFANMGFPDGRATRTMEVNMPAHDSQQHPARRRLAAARF
jgi:hypothetical protein